MTKTKQKQLINDKLKKIFNRVKPSWNTARDLKEIIEAIRSDNLYMKKKVLEKYERK